MPEGGLIGAHSRVFLFLQGPHGPFFARLASVLLARGSAVHKVAFNAADAAEWRGAGPLHRFRSRELAVPGAFEGWLEALCTRLGVTDIVLYGDTRPPHRAARAMAARRGIIPHCFEEGYLRPHWITYERQGCNAGSRLAEISIPRMAAALGEEAPPGEEVPATWGDARQHQLHSLGYHLRLIASGAWRRQPHRAMPVWLESLVYLRRALAFPWVAARRALRQALLLRGGRPFHLVLLQLSFDSSMRDHSDFGTSAEFIERVIDAFAVGAPRDHLLVLKAHPFEDGRERLARIVRVLARDLGVADRVVFIDGGKKLAALLDRARAALTVNSTAAQQALWRGLPVKALGRAIYRKPGLISEQALEAFVGHPMRPDMRAYRVFRRFVLETSQIRGSFYAVAGIEALMATLPGLMLDPVDRYDRVLDGAGAGQLRGDCATPPILRPVPVAI